MTSSSSYPAKTIDGNSLIEDAYEVLIGQSLPFSGGGLIAYAVKDHRYARQNLMAIQSAEGSPERPFALINLRLTPIDNILLPLAHGVARGVDGREGWFLIVPQPPGDPVRMPLASSNTAQRIWSESELLNCVVRPIAQALVRLSTTGMTHRAIRPDNVFQEKPGQAVTLGCAWAGPAAALQPALFDPPYSSMCPPCARGEGTIADDVYAMGVLLVTLSSNKPLLEGLDEDAVIRRKLAHGCFLAICGDLRLPPTIADLVHGMLADDPDHRPSVLSLLSLGAARDRKIISRPRKHAPRSIIVGSVSVTSARCLSFELARQPGVAIRLLVDRSISAWARRTLGDPALANRLEDAVRVRAADLSVNSAGSDALLVMSAVAILDPLSPLCWRGLPVFPNGIGPALAHTASTSNYPSMQDILVDLVQSDAVVQWCDIRGNQSDLPSLRTENRQRRILLRLNGWLGGIARLRYTLNPLLPCRSPLLGTHCVARISDLLPALEQRDPGNTEMIDPEIAAFIAARIGNRTMDADLIVITSPRNHEVEKPDYVSLAQLRIFACLAMLDSRRAWPKIANDLLHKVTPALDQWRSKTIRASREMALLTAARDGSIEAMLQVFDDQPAHRHDTLAGKAAEKKLVAIEQKLYALQKNQHLCASIARVAGQEIATALSIIGLAISAVIAAL